VLGDDVRPADPYEAIVNGSAAGKPVLVMSMKRESDLMKLGLPMGSVLLPVLAGVIGPMAVRGVGLEVFTKEAEAALPPKAAANVWADLIKGFAGIRAKKGLRGGGKLDALNYLFGTCGIATSKLVDALQGASGAAPVYAALLELSAKESPKLGNGHTADLFLLFRCDNPGFDRFMAETLRGKSSFGPALDKLSANMLNAWTTFAKGGSPGAFDSVEWPTMPSHMIMKSSGSVVEKSDHASSSDELALWKRVCTDRGVPMPYFKEKKGAI